MSDNTNLPTQQFPRHDPQLLENSIQQAEEFYQWDKQLTVADRRKLSSYFWQKIAVYPFISFPVVYGFIVAPNYLKRRGFLDPKKSYRILQVALGFAGLGVGSQLSGLVSSTIHMQMLQSNPPAQNAYRCLKRYPPQLGSRYFSMTAQNPELRMRDPDTIDWKSNPLFPIVLVMNQKLISEVKRMEKERAAKYNEMHQNHVKQEIERRSHAGDKDKTPELTGTSWDKVIAQNEDTQVSGYQSKPSSTSTYGSARSQSSPQPVESSSLPSSSGLPPPPPSLSSSGETHLPPPPPSPLGTWGSIPRDDDAISEEQRKFDEMLEKEREEAMQDDFANTESKWD